jgi:hypothetical protein
MRADMENLSFTHSQIPPQPSLVPTMPTTKSSTTEHELRKKMAEMVLELENSLKERAKLVEISNSLRASIKKVSTKDATTQCIVQSRSLSVTGNQKRLPLSNTSTNANLLANQFRQSLIKNPSVRNYNEK